MRQTCTSSPKKEGVAAPNLHGEPEKRRGRCAKPARRAGKKKGAVRQTCTTSLAQEPPTPPRALFDLPNFSPRPEIFACRPTLERPRADETSRPSFGGKASGPRKTRAIAGENALSGVHAPIRRRALPPPGQRGFARDCSRSGRCPNSEHRMPVRVHRFGESSTRRRWRPRSSPPSARRGKGSERRRWVRRRFPTPTGRRPQSGEGRGTSPLDAPVRGVARFIRIRLHDDVPRRGSRVLFHKAMGFLVRFPLLSRLRRD